MAPSDPIVVWPGSGEGDPRNSVSYGLGAPSLGPLRHFLDQNDRRIQSRTRSAGLMRERAWAVARTSARS